jgi:hypothetical protein
LLDLVFFIFLQADFDVLTQRRREKKIPLPTAWKEKNPK